MKIFLGADHGGFDLKEKIETYLKGRGFVVVDDGNTQLQPDDDFPVFAAKVVQDMRASDDPDARGILICSGGQGMAMAANRFKGIRASVIWDEEEAKMARHDNDSNVLALPARVLKKGDQWQAIVDSWLNTPFASLTRYVRRNHELDEL